MNFISTKGTSISSIEDALMSGTSEDGGLYMPESIPKINIEELMSIDNYQEFSYQLLSHFFKDSSLEDDLKDIVNQAFNFPVVSKEYSEGEVEYSVLELFHGPTAAFKDFGARFLASTMSELVKNKNESSLTTILVATSGDTGGAVASAFNNKTDFKVVILFPKGRVSPRQKHQLTCWGDNVVSIEVDGEFDDCQRLVKEAFNNQQLSKEHNLCSANSINIGRLLPQSTYYAWTALNRYKTHEDSSSFIIPTGNLGNAFACFMAKEMGFHIHQIVFATNANKTIPDFIATGKWEPRPTLPTLASAMDVGNPSNMERFFNQYSDEKELLENLEAYIVEDTQINEEIFSVFKNNNIAICPHTATGFNAFKNLPSSALNQSHWVLVSTAHPAKFENIVEPIIGTKVEIPENLKTILNLDTSYHAIGKDLESLIPYLEH